MKKMSALILSVVFLSSTTFAATSADSEGVLNLFATSIASAKCPSGLILSQNFDGQIVREAMADLLNAKKQITGGSDTLDILDQKLKEINPAIKIVQVPKSEVEARMQFRQGGLFYKVTFKNNSMIVGLNSSANFFCKQN